MKNTATFTPTELERFVEDFVSVSSREIQEKGTSGVLFIQGDTGIDKSTIIHRVAERLGYVVVSEYVGTLGIDTAFTGPVAAAKEGDTLVAVKSQGRLLKKIEEAAKDPNAKGVILFLDRVDEAPSLVQSALLSLVRERKVGGVELPSKVIIIAASGSVGSPSEFADILLKFASVKVKVKTDPKGFLNYAQEARIHPAVLAFVDQNPDKYNERFDVGGVVYDTSPRTLSKLSEALYAMEELGRTVDEKKISAYVGPEASESIYTYYSILHASPIMRQLKAVVNSDFGKPFYPKEFYQDIKAYIQNEINNRESSAVLAVPLMLAQSLCNEISSAKGVGDYGAFLRGMKASLALFEAFTHSLNDEGDVAKSMAESFKESLNTLYANLRKKIAGPSERGIVSEIADVVELGKVLGEAVYKGDFSIVDKEFGDRLTHVLQSGREHIRETCLIATEVYIKHAAESNNSNIAEYYRKVDALTSDITQKSFEQELQGLEQNSPSL